MKRVERGGKCEERQWATDILLRMTFLPFTKIVNKLSYRGCNLGNPLVMIL